MKKRVLAAILAAMTMLVLCVGCKSGKDDSKDKSKTKTYAIIYPLVHPFFEPIGTGAQKYVEDQKLGYKILVKAPQQADVNQQIEIIENLIAMKVDGIAIGAIDADALVAPINRAVDAGIPVLTFDTDAPKSKRSGYIGTDNEKAGKHLGEVIIEELNNKGDIFVLNGNPSQLNHIQRLKGLRSALEDSGVKLLDVQTGMGDPNLSINTVESMIEAYPNFTSLVGVGGDGGPAGIAVWKAKGWTGENRKKKIITFDNTPENIQGLRDGMIDAIVSQNQHKWGKLIVDSLDALNRGEKIEEFVDTGSVKVTKENVDTYQND